jgi:osmoprotectant transport system substrate-binding protein
VLDAYPQIAAALNAVNAKIDTPVITALNAKVDLNKREYQDVAQEFYQSIKVK